MKPLVPARLHFSEKGTPFSDDYDDVYHAEQGSIAQARHVFLQGNGLPEGWRNRASFTICETGFGLGTNFLTTWDAWRKDPHRPARLHFLSLEAHPFRREDLATLWQQAPADWQSSVNALLAQWPVLTPGLHRLEFDGGRVTLTLAFGLARDLASTLRAQVDAFFFDGFSPAKNPEMWSLRLFKSLSYLARRGATAATWCSAGAVRRTLQQIGFEVEKRPGFAGKQHMTVARYLPTFTPRHGLQERQPAQERMCVVVGGGIAAAGVAYALRQRGWRVQVVAAPSVLTPLMGHVAAAITPTIARDDNLRARLSRAAVLRARSRWAPWLGSSALLPCGTLHLARDAEQAARFSAAVDTLQFPSAWLQFLDEEAASRQAGVKVARSAWWLPQAMRIQPEHMIPALLEGSHVCHAKAWQVLREDKGWRVVDSEGATLAEAPTLVLANAWDSVGLLNRSGLTKALDAPLFLDSKRVAGQINGFATDTQLGVRCIVAGDGYVLPSVEGLTVVGGTYVYDDENFAANAAGEALNRAHLQALLPEHRSPVGAGLPANARVTDSRAEPAPTGERRSLGAWAGYRHELLGRLPLIAEYPGASGLWVCAGYASKGMSWAALAGDILAANLDAEPQFIESDLLDIIAWR